MSPNTKCWIKEIQPAPISYPVCAPPPSLLEEHNGLQTTTVPLLTGLLAIYSWSEMRRAD